MKQENFSELSDQELFQKIKSLRTNQIIDAFAVGITIGIVVYSAIKMALVFLRFSFNLNLFNY